MSKPLFKFGVFILMLLCVELISAQTAVEKHGNLITENGYLLDKNGKIVQLRGMSFFWTRGDWPGAKYYTAATVDALVDSWKCTVLRVAINRDKGNNDAADWNTAKIVVDEAIKKGIYVILDWHAYDAEQHAQNAISFFTDQAKAYKSTPNVIFEPYNEPIGSDVGNLPNAEKTWKAIKPYLTNVTKAIRDQGANNLVVIGTPYYSQFVVEAATDTIPYSNCAYAFHFYAASHGSGQLPYYVKEDGGTAMEDTYLSGGLGKVAVFITEWGTTHSNGGQDGKTHVDGDNTKWWFDHYVNGDYHLSWCNWSVSDFQASSAFQNNATAPNLNPSESGAIVKGYLTNTADSYDPPWESGSSGPANDSVFAMPGTHPAGAFNRSFGNISAMSIPYSTRDLGDPRTAKNKLNIASGNGENWASYFLNVSSQQKYFNVRYISPDAAGTLEIDIGSTKIGQISLDKTGSWVTKSLQTTSPVPAGKDTLKLKATGLTGAVGIEWFEISNDPSATTIVQRQIKLENAKINLVKNGFTVNLPFSHNYSSYFLFGANGRIVKTGMLNSSTRKINFTKLSGGIWFFKLKGFSGEKLYKAVINN